MDQGRSEVGVGYDPGRGPFSHRDEAGAFFGNRRGFLKLIGQRTGLVFKPVHSRSWTGAYEGAKARTAPGGKLMLRVRDQGPGVTPDEMPQGAVFIVSLPAAGVTAVL